MPTFREGDMWSVWDQSDYFVITTNSVVKPNGAVVMGRGIAKQVRDQFPGIDVQIGKTIERTCGSMGVYGFLQGHKVCVFQVKRHYMDQAEFHLIRTSVDDLTAAAKAEPNALFSLNFPGIGNGGLDYADVKPLLEPLPRNVHVWTFGPPPAGPDEGDAFSIY